MLVFVLSSRYIYENNITMLQYCPRLYLQCDYTLWFPFASSVGEIELILFQPHLQRTKLCDMEDQELDPLYVKKRDQLKEVVASMIKPKIVQGRTLNGTEFVSFLGQVILLAEFITGTEFIDISLQNII
jgi:hypothetical protein